MLAAVRRLAGSLTGLGQGSWGRPGFPFTTDECSAKILVKRRIVLVFLEHHRWCLFLFDLAQVIQLDRRWAVGQHVQDIHTFSATRDNSRPWVPRPPFHIYMGVRFQRLQFLKAFCDRPSRSLHKREPIPLIWMYDPKLAHPRCHTITSLNRRF